MKRALRELKQKLVEMRNKLREALPNWAGRSLELTVGVAACLGLMELALDYFPRDWKSLEAAATLLIGKWVLPKIEKLLSTLRKGVN